MFSRRTGWNLAQNRLTSAIEAHRRAGREILDLTISNPTRAGIDYPTAEIAAALASGPAEDYSPEPKGARAAREAIAQQYGRRGSGDVDPDRIVLTPGTSEAYAWLFKLLCDPGDRVLVPRPSYPLFEFLAALESVEVSSYPMRYETRWEIDRGALDGRLHESGPEIERPVAPRAALPGSGLFAPEGASSGRLAAEEDRPAAPSDGRTRAIVVVNPNNPTGSFLSRSDLAFLTERARHHRLPIISDEVFSSDTLPAAASSDLVTTLSGSDEVPAFILDGISKSAGLPGLKLGWILANGPTDFRESALSRLEVIADTYLPVASPVQRALPRLLELGEVISARIRARVRANDALVGSAAPAGSACEALRTEGGWSAVIRVPRRSTEEKLCLRLLETDDVLVQPGWFFDFEAEAYLVVSLLTPEAAFREGLSRILSRAR